MKKREKTSFLGTTFLLALCSMGSLILGVLRTRIFTHYFSLDELDPYNAAFTIPDIIYQTIIIGAVSASLIPIMLDLRGNRNKREMYLFLSSVFNFGFFVLLSLSMVVFVFAPSLVPLLVPGFAGQPQKIEETVALIRIMLASPVFMGVASIAKSILNGYQNFLIPALTPIFYNLGIIGTTLIFGRSFNTMTLGLGVVVGSALYLLILVFPLTKIFPLRHYRLIFFHRKIWTMVKLAIPRFFSIGVVQLGIIVDTVFASCLIPGSMSMNRIAFQIQNMPINIFAVNTSTIAFTALVEYATEKDWKKFNITLINSIRQTLFFTLPLSLIFIFLAKEIVTLFASIEGDELVLTAFCVVIYATSIWAQSILYVVVKGFYAMYNTVTPFFISFVAILLKIIIIFAIYMLTMFQVSHGSVPSPLPEYVLIIPFTFALTQIITAILLLFFLHKKTALLNQHFFDMFKKLFVPLLGMLLILLFWEYVFEPYLHLPNGEITQCLKIGIISFFSVVFFFFVSYLYRIPEAEQVVVGSMRRFIKSKQVRE